MAKVVLTVDDSVTIRMMVGFTLREAGYEVIEAADGKSALEALADSPVDLVITDVNMPGINGLDLIGEIRKRAELKFVPVLVLSTEFHDEKKDLARRAGATGWLVKPFKPDQLVEVVRKVIG